MPPQENSTYSSWHKTFIQNSHFIAVRRREEPSSKDTELPGGDLGQAGRGKPWPVPAAPLLVGREAAGAPARLK